MEGLNLDNILDEDEVNLFSGTSEESDDEGQEKETEQQEQQETTEVDTNQLFSDKPKSVGSEDNNEEQEDTPDDEGNGDSPNSDFFSSIAKALTEEGILPDLDEETIKDIKTPEDLRKAIDDYIQSELSEQQQRIKAALDNNVKPDAIRQYEGVLGYLNSIDENTLRAESEESEDLRKKLIYQDFINRGFSAERAEKEVNKSLQGGSDIEDAIEALKSNKAFYTNGYNTLLSQAQYAAQEEENQRKARTLNIRNTIFDEKQKFFGELELDKNTRQRIFDSISKPVYKDKETGDVYTAIQKYELDHGDDFLIKLGLVFTLTDGFKNLDGLVKGKVKKEVKKGFRELESRINNTARDTYGNLKYTSGVDENSYIGKGLKLAI